MEGAPRRSHRTTNVLLTMLVVAIIAVPTMYAIAATTTSSSQPANKTVASGSELKVFAPGTATPLLATTSKASAPTDLLFNVSLECDILDQVTSTAGGTTFSEA